MLPENTTSGKTDVYGKPVPGVRYPERCAIIKLNVRDQKTAVRADSSASRGNAHELITNAILLMTATTKVRMDDIVIVAGHPVKIFSRAVMVVKSMLASATTPPDAMKAEVSEVSAPATSRL